MAAANIADITPKNISNFLLVFFLGSSAPTLATMVGFSICCRVLSNTLNAVLWAAAEMPTDAFIAAVCTETLISATVKNAAKSP